MDKEEELIELLQKCKNGKNSAQEELFKKFYSYGLTVCMHYCTNRLEAEDVLIEGFFKVFNAMEKFDFTKPFKPWLRRILINAAIDHHRKYNKLKTTEDALRIEDISYEYSGLEKVHYDDLLMILQELPTQYRLVFNLYEIEGYKHEEIAHQLGITISTSKSNLSRAKQKMRIMIEKFEVQLKRKG